MPRFAIDGLARDFVPIKTFRAAHNLPESFGVALFEPKDFTGLGSIDRAGAALNTVRAAVLAALPERMAANDWLNVLPGLARLFESKLYEINHEVGLREPEIGFAVSGFLDVLQAVAYAVIRARASGAPPPTFERVYAGWLDGSIRVSQTVHRYAHEGAEWSIRVITNAYGRAGMIIEAGEATYYVYDGALACPAEGFMARLLAEVAARMVGASH